MPPVATDGSSRLDAPRRVEIDLDDARDRWRYTCPNRHTSWEPTNGGLWCHSCSKDPGIEDPHHHALYDSVRKERVPWSAVVLG